MPIEIKEISIKADIYPAKERNSAGGPSQALTAQDIERLKKEIAREVTQAVLQKVYQTTER
jgi:hypothetical protein